MKNGPFRYMDTLCTMTCLHDRASEVYSKALVLVFRLIDALSIMV